MHRLVVLGCSGSGKSRLSVELGRRLNLPVIHADKVFWKPGWTDPDNEEYRSEIDDLTSGEGWVFDGTPGRVPDIVLPRADTILWLEQPAYLCALRGYWRMLRYVGRTRPDMAEGCHERLNLQLWQYAATFERVQRPKIEGWLEAYAGAATVLRLQGDGGVSSFLEQASGRSG